MNSEQQKQCREEFELAYLQLFPHREQPTYDERRGFYTGCNHDQAMFQIFQAAYTPRPDLEVVAKIIYENYHQAVNKLYSSNISCVWENNLTEEGKRVYKFTTQAVIDAIFNKGTK
jgi:hypothetical protein